MKELLQRIQSPQTAIGKNIRDAVIAGLSYGLIQALEGINTIDFGEYDMIVAAIITLVVSTINRETREIKREK